MHSLKAGIPDHLHLLICSPLHLQHVMESRESKELPDHSPYSSQPMLMSLLFCLLKEGSSHSARTKLAPVSWIPCLCLQLQDIPLSHTIALCTTPPPPPQVTGGLSVLGTQDADLAELTRILQRELQQHPPHSSLKGLLCSPCHQHQSARALIYKLDVSQGEKSESHICHYCLCNSSHWRAPSGFYMPLLLPNRRAQGSETS